MGGPSPAGSEGSDESTASGGVQDVSHTHVGRDLYQVSGGFHLGGPGFLLAVATIAVVALLIAGGFYVRGRQAGDARKRQSAASLSSPAVAGGGISRTTRPPVTEPVIGVVTDTDPLNLGSEQLKEIYGRNQDWMIPRPQIVKGEPKADQERPAAGFYKFVKERGGVAMNRLFFGATVQNLTGGAVYLRSMRVTGLKCGPPLKGTRVWAGGGADPLVPRAVLIDLDASGPTPLYFPRIPEEWLSRSGSAGIDPRKAKPFGFTLPRGGSESFDFVALSFQHRSCEFTLAITAVLNGQSKQITIDDDGRPFRVAGNPGIDYWMYSPSSPPLHQWTRPSRAEAGEDQILPGPGPTLAENDS